MRKFWGAYTGSRAPRLHGVLAPLCRSDSSGGLVGFLRARGGFVPVYTVSPPRWRGEGKVERSTKDQYYNKN